MKPNRVLLALVLPGMLAHATAPASDTLAELARRCEWEAIAEHVAALERVRPLEPTEALVAAVAAVHRGSPAPELLARAAGPSPTGLFAVLLQARALANANPAATAALLPPLLRRPPSTEVGEAALDLARAAAVTDLPQPVRTALESSRAGLPTASQRRLELALAAADATSRRARVGRLLQRSQEDLVALEAARVLEGYEDLTTAERFLIAQAWYQHGLYERASAELDRVIAAAPAAGAPPWEAHLTRGRCAFRLGRWQEAAAWYGAAAWRAGSAEERATAEVHIARSLELDGHLEEAVAAARRAVGARSNDERRLLLARLRARQNRIDLAEQNLAAIRSASQRERGQLMIAVAELRTGAVDRAERRLAPLRRKPWREAAVVLGARLAAERGAWPEALEALERRADWFDDYWGGAARRIVAAAPPEMRVERMARLAARSADGDRSATVALAVLGPAPTQEDPGAARSRAAGAGAAPPGPAPSFPPGLASELWTLGLEREAALWDARGLPNRTGAESAWSAERMTEVGRFRQAIRLAEHARQQIGAPSSPRALTKTLLRCLYPLPWPDSVRTAATAAGVRWSLLAALVREESRWDPQARSAVGARGLAQLMPATATAIARATGSVEVEADDLFSPELSLRLGAHELGRLVDRFDGRAAIAVAAYNAGEAQARVWGDACPPRYSEECFVAAISFDATRRYTAAVLAAAEIYEGLYPLVNGAGGSPAVAPAPAGSTARSPR